ncbi:hypothetical protein ACFL20_07635 [Spirochaetota bacterium]
MNTLAGQNPDITVKPVESKKMLKEFIKIPWTTGIYKNDTAWVPPIIFDQMKILDPKKGWFFEFGEVQLFIAYKGRKPVGRISAHVDQRYEEKYDKGTGFFGFYEAINDPDVARSLFFEAEEWLRSKGKKTMNGPQSFSVYDPIGFEVKGEDIMPVVGLFHYAPYYNDHVKALGFSKSTDWHAILVKLETYNEYFNVIRDELMKGKDWDYVALDKKQIKKRAQDLKNIFNVAWEGNHGHLPFTDKQFDLLFDELSPIVIPELAQFAEKDGKTIAFMLTVPDVNPFLKKLNGRLYPWRVIRLLFDLKFRKPKRLRTILLGVLPEHRGKHIDDIFYLMGIPWAKANGYEVSECSLIVESNKKMLGAIKNLNGEIYKTYRLYEKSIG